MKKIYTLFIVLISLVVNAQDWVWSNHFKGDGNTYVSKMITDEQDNYYVLGEFDGTVDDNGTAMTSFGDRDIYLTKYSSIGNYVWRTRIGSSLRDWASSLTLDSEGNIYVVGGFQGDCRFDNDTLTSSGNYDIFLAKYNTNGTKIWNKKIGWSPNLERPYDIKYNKITNKLISVGYFSNILYAGNETNTINNDTIVGSGIDNYIEELDTAGNLLWIKAILGNSNSSRISTIASTSNSYYFLINITDSMYFDIGNFKSISAGLNDILLYKTDFNGNGSWVRKIEGTANELAYSLGVDATTGVYISGYFRSATINFVGSTFSLANKTGNLNQIFVAKYNELGDCIWVDSKGSTGHDYSYGLNVRGNSLLVTGGFCDSLITTNDTSTTSATTNSDPYMLLYDLAGVDKYSFKLTGNLEDIGYGAAISSRGDYIFAGTFKSNDLYIASKTDPLIADTLTNSLPGNTDGFIAKYGCRSDIFLSYTKTDATCPGSSNGELIVTPTAPDAWNYAWVGTNATGQTIPNLTGLTDNEWYYTTITSPKGCAYNDSIQMNHKPVLQASLIDSITVNCLASNNGIATVIPSSGYITGDTLTTDYNYLWDDGNTDSLRTDLTVGTHFVTITDLCGNTTEIIDSVKVENLPTLQAYVQTQNVIVLCDTSSNGQSRVIYQDGLAPYTFIWENSSTPTTSDIANDLNVGIHHVTITDFCNVPIIDSVTIVNIPTIGSQISDFENATCLLSNNGSANVTAYNGVEPYNITWSASTSTANLANDLPANTMVYVTVSDVCHQAVDSVLIGVNPALDLNFSNIQNAKCASTNDGFAQVDLTNQQGTITYAWSASTSDSSSAILPGNTMVHVTVTDLCGPVLDSTFIGVYPILEAQIENLNELVLCDTSSNGTATVIYENGIAPYTFVWENSSSTSNIANDLNVGIHHVTITDFCNTTIIDSIQIINVPTIATQISNSENATCIGSNNGSAITMVFNGIEPYNYQWSASTSTANLANDLPANTMVYVTVSDVCHQAVDSVLIGVNPALDLNFSNIQNAKCASTNDGFAQVDLTNQQGTITYAWSASTSDSSSAILPGNTMVHVTVTDLCGPITDSVLIGVNPLAEIEFSNITNANCTNTNDGSAQATILNGQSTISYLWEASVNDTNSIATDLSAGYQTITITDLCGPITDSVLIGVNPALQVTSIVENTLCNADSTGRITLTTENEFGLVHYLWASLTDTTSIIDSLPAGTYSYTITDGCNNPITNSLIITSPTALIDSVIFANASELGANDGNAIVYVSGGTPSYTYVWSNGNLSDESNNLTTGTYYYTITDANNCYISDSIVIEANKYDIVTYNTFTPNNDGVNDVWNIAHIEHFPKCKVNIYSQWGNLVFTSDEGYTKPWNGLVDNSGKELPAGTYYYTISLGIDDVMDKSGSVAIMK